MSENKRLLVIEPNATGHRMIYARWLIEGAARAGFTPVLATTPGALSNVVVQSMLHRRELALELVTVDGLSRQISGRSRIRQAIGQLRAFRWCYSAMQAAERSGPISAVVLPYVDSCFYAIGVLGSPFGSRPWAAITMRQMLSVHGLRASLRRAFTRRVSRARGLTGLFCIEPSMRTLQASTRFDKISYLPDPAELRSFADPKSARHTLGVPEEAFVVLVFGAIDVRKGLVYLLEGMSELGCLEEVCILIAGAQSREIRELLSNHEFRDWAARRQIVEIDRFLDDDDVAAVFAASDCVWLGYVGHSGMSGVAVLAGRVALPIIACNEGEIGQLALTLRTGPVVDVSEPLQVAAAISELRVRSNWERYAQAGVAAFSEHTPEKFASSVVGALSESRRSS